jgi:hypothetical protein
MNCPYLKIRVSTMSLHKSCFLFKADIGIQFDSENLLACAGNREQGIGKKG